MTSPYLSVVICTHNPRQDFIHQVLEALSKQTLAISHWEMIVVDNASTVPLNQQLVDTGAYPEHMRIVVESQLGLTAARLRGYQEAQSDWIVYVDDDNVLAPTYLQAVYDITQQYQNLGAFSGKSLPSFEMTPAPWISDFYNVLAIRDMGEEVLISAQIEDSSKPEYPDYAPAGAGMVVNKTAFGQYVDRVKQDQRALALGRKGKKLTSGEDNDIVLTLFNRGWRVGYFPQLQLTHLIAASRLERNYMARLNRAAYRSWVQVLDMHGIRHWSKIPSWSVLPRQIKAFLTHQAWRSPEAYIHWSGSCGQIEARGTLS
ncbi:MAG: glycosyltransferase [Cyanobacteria bacterium P01_F01_bin.42]